MIEFIVVENGLSIVKWENLDDSIELKKFLDNCDVPVKFVNMSNPFKVTEEDWSNQKK